VILTITLACCAWSLLFPDVESCIQTHSMQPQFQTYGETKQPKHLQITTTTYLLDCHPRPSHLTSRSYASQLPMCVYMRQGNATVGRLLALLTDRTSKDRFHARARLPLPSGDICFSCVSGAPSYLDALLHLPCIFSILNIFVSAYIRITFRTLLGE
jgi:hypothetical protein